MKLHLISTVLKVPSYNFDSGSKIEKKKKRLLLERTCDIYSAQKSTF